MSACRLRIEPLTDGYWTTDGCGHKHRTCEAAEHCERRVSIPPVYRDGADDFDLPDDDAGTPGDWTDDLMAGGPTGELNPHWHCDTADTRPCPRGEHANPERKREQSWYDLPIAGWAWFGDAADVEREA